MTCRHADRSDGRRMIDRRGRRDCVATASNAMSEYFVNMILLLLDDWGHDEHQQSRAERLTLSTALRVEQPQP